MKEQYHNISAYKFIKIESLLPLRGTLYDFCLAQGLKGTILLSDEGININLIGFAEAISKFTFWLQEQPLFHDMTFKLSLSSTQSFQRLKVKIKDEIIAMHQDDIDPTQTTAKHISATTLKQWYDGNKDMLVLDTRNTYEAALGSFDNAMELPIETFREFPKAIKKIDVQYKTKPVVTFCTGGVRCEKATAEMIKQGFTEVYQLEGGILQYFEQCGDAHYHGECFVFDDRVSVDGNLKETDNYKHLLGQPRLTCLQELES